MTRWHLKLVPDAEPNADGEWITIGLATEPTFDMIVRPGTHIVAIKRAYEDRSGESMHQTMMRGIYGRKE